MMKILLCHYDSTGNTARIADEIGDRLIELGAVVDRFDATAQAARDKKFDFGRYDAAVFGAPIQADRAPRIFRDWLRTLNGRGLKCAVFFTYEGSQISPNRHDTRRILVEQNFVLSASADFPDGWDPLADLSARSYADALFEKFDGHNPRIDGRPAPGTYSEDRFDQIEKFRFQMAQLPTRNGAGCRMCRLCEQQCPTRAMNAKKGLADPGWCIVCMACVDNCPDQALKINEPGGFLAFKPELGPRIPDIRREMIAHQYI